MATLTSGLVLGALLGAGSFGEVFQGNDPALGPVAVKVIRRQVGESNGDWQARKEGLLKEGKRLAVAEHANVIRVFQVLESSSDDSVHLVMELCTGGSLDAAYRTNPLPLLAVRDVATQVAMGLYALHSRGMLHRDLKPANILRDGKGVAKIGDFGLVTDDLVFGYASSQGYLDHLAPEVHAGLGTSVQTDIWAFGMTVFRLLHGDAWYIRHPSPAELIPDGGFVNRLKWLPHVPKQWRRFVRKCLCDDKDVRYRYCEEVLEALSHLPVMPQWDCQVLPGRVDWRREVNARHVSVSWQQISPRKHVWKADSLPLAGLVGRTRHLGGTAVPVSASKAVQGLTSLFVHQAALA